MLRGEGLLHFVELTLSVPLQSCDLFFKKFLHFLTFRVRSLLIFVDEVGILLWWIVEVELVGAGLVIDDILKFFGSFD